MTPFPLIDFAGSGDLTPRWNPSEALTLGLASPASPHRRWRIWHRDGSVASHSFTPPASRAEVESWYPGAALVPEPEEPQ